MKKHPMSVVLLCLPVFVLLCFSTSALAKIEWDIVNNIPLADTPRDIAISSDGTAAYILCKKNIFLYSVKENKVTDTIPLSGDFSKIALSPDGEKLLLTDASTKQMSIIRISQIYDMPIGSSPVIGKEGAPVTIFAFIDYQ